MDLNSISETIKDGLRKGYKQNLLLLSSYGDFTDQVREYLLTVNVAQHLLEWNDNHAYKIQIEYPVLDFYNNAFRKYKILGEDIFTLEQISRDDGHSPTDKRYQKVDLAITQEQVGDNGSDHERTLVGIELKGINKREEDIKSDAVRLASAMLENDKIGKNSIEFCFCGFLKRLDKSEEVITSKIMAQKINQESVVWDKICNHLNQLYPQLQFSVEIFEINNTAYEVVASIHKQMGSDYSEVANDTGIVSGGILTIQRK